MVFSGRKNICDFQYGYNLQFVIIQIGLEKKDFYVMILDTNPKTYLLIVYHMKMMFDILKYLCKIFYTDIQMWLQSLYQLELELIIRRDLNKCLNKVEFYSSFT